MTHEEKAIAVSYAQGVMDTLAGVVLLKLSGLDEDTHRVYEVVSFAKNRLNDILEED